MADFDNVKNIQKLFNQKSLLDIAIEVEKFLDYMNIYVYPNWREGEIVDGPNVGRYFITTTLKYDYEKMPDPMGARILHDIGVKVKYTKDVEMDPIKVKSPNDFRPNSKKPKLMPKKIWYIEIKIPRRFIDEIDYTELEDMDDEIDVQDVQDATDSGLANQEEKAAPLPANEMPAEEQGTDNV